MIKAIAITLLLASVAAAGACRAVMTDSEIAAVAEVLKGMQ